ncbi:STAS domain-containing protein [Streptomyces sp. CC224B]|uniref:STAS domain-containing protein n=1 Tax=Streptomyces sp. CC224B TaxID=3044571 RepID=UPI0024A9F619|nr:STAS domain-containing protein [Streptomyces sp. CC224B]
MPDFTVTAIHHLDGTVIAVTGELDIRTCPRVEEATAVLPVGNKTLHLDLSGVSFMDSMGLNLLLRLRNRIHGSGGHLVLAGVQAQPCAVLRLTEAHALFDITCTTDGLIGSAH